MNNTRYFIVIFTSIQYNVLCYILILQFFYMVYYFLLFIIFMYFINSGTIYPVLIVSFRPSSRSRSLLLLPRRTVFGSSGPRNRWPAAGFAMPTFILSTNVPVDAVVASDILKDCTRTVAKILGKPESVRTFISLFFLCFVLLGKLERVRVHATLGATKCSEKFLSAGLSRGLCCRFPGFSYLDYLFMCAHCVLLLLGGV